MAEEYLPSQEDLELLDPTPPDEGGEEPMSADDIAQLRSRAEMVERFYGDPAYARQIIAQMAPQLGLQVGAPQAPPPTQAPQAQPAPEAMVTRMRDKLGPDLAFLAPQMAGAMWEVIQEQIAPLRQRQDDALVQQRTSDYTRAAQVMDQEMPGWVQHESDMVGILQFMTEAANGGPLMHPRYGSALKLLHTLATGNAQATATVARRQADAARSASRSSSGVRAPQATLEQQLRKLPNRHSQLAAAFKDTVRELGIEAF